MGTIHSNYRKILVSFLLLVGIVARGQFYDCSSGLLSMPSADMNPSGTFMVTSDMINKNTISQWYWGYNTYSYGINITFWSRLEVGYVCVLTNGRKNPNPKDDRHAIMINQDRHFTAKLQLLKEGEFGLNWIPALSIGTSDPTTAGTGLNPDYSEMQVEGAGNGFFNRYYLVATKHFNTKVGRLGAHLGYQYNKRSDFPMNGPCAAVDWVPIWLDSEMLSVKAILEYDSRTVNTGVVASMWNGRFDVMVELINMRWLVAGLRFKTVLKI